MRTALAASLAAVFVAASAPNSALTGRDRLTGKSESGDLVVVDEAYRVSGGRVRLVRRSEAGPIRTCLEVEAGAADAASLKLSYRRSVNDDPGAEVAIDVAEGAMTVQVGSAIEKTQVHGSPVPTSLLRFLSPGAVYGRRLLIEPYGLVARGHVTSYVDPRAEAQVHVWEAAGLTERVRSRANGHLVDVVAPQADLVLTQAELAPDDHPLRGCGDAPNPTAATERFDDLSPPSKKGASANPEVEGNRADAWDALRDVRSPWDLTPWVTARVRYEEADTIPTADEVLDAGTADCVGMSLLAGAAARALGWKARQVLGVVDGPDGWAWHQWAEVKWGGRWVRVDPAAPLAERRAVRRFAATPRAVLAGEVAVLTGKSPDPAFL